MEFSVFNLMEQRDPQKSTASILNEAVQQTRLADELGYGAAWFAEHHFSNYCICPSPLLMIARCAGETKQIKLGSGILVLPLYDPVRLVSEVAMIDALCDGRFLLGVGGGYQPYEFQRFGLDLSDSWQRSEEILDIIELGLSQEEFSFAGRYYSLPKSHVAPRPTNGVPPVWLAGAAPAMFRRAARKGYVPFVTAKTGPTSGAVAVRDRCAEMFAEEGVPVDRMPFGLQRHCYVTDSKDDALSFVENVRYQLRLAGALRRREETWEGHALVERPGPDEQSLDEMLANMLVGDSHTIAERLSHEIRAVNPSHVCLHTQTGAVAHGAVMHSIGRFADEVIPLIEKEIGPIGSYGTNRQVPQKNSKRKAAG